MKGHMLPLDARNPEGALTEASTLSGFSPVRRPAGDRTSFELRSWPKPAAVRSEDRLPVAEECASLAARQSSFRSTIPKDPRSFWRPPSPPVSLWPRVEPSVRFPFLPARPSVRFPFLPALAFQPVSRLSSRPSWRFPVFPAPSFGFPLRRGRKSRPSTHLAQARNLIVFRELDSLFAIPSFCPSEREKPRGSLG